MLCGYGDKLICLQQCFYSDAISAQFVSVIFVTFAGPKGLQAKK